MLNIKTRDIDVQKKTKFLKEIYFYEFIKIVSLFRLNLVIIINLSFKFIFI